MDLESAAKLLRERLEQHTHPIAIGRHGATELRVLLFYTSMRLYGTPYPNYLVYQMEHEAGLFPATPEMIDKWAHEYLSSLKMFDLYVTGWVTDIAEQESGLMNAYAPDTIRGLPLRVLEPYYVNRDIQWSNGLQNKHVAVVSSFANTMEKQLRNKECIWGDIHNNILPSSAKWSFVKTGYCPKLAGNRDECKWPPFIKTWEDAVDYIVNEVKNTGAEIALIGCGSLGVLISSRLKKLGISSVVMGAAIQVIFGIKGNRWETHDIIGKLWNSAWIYPSESEIPEYANRFEGACYWK
jgi:hypothetical protein